MDDALNRWRAREPAGTLRARAFAADATPQALTNMSGAASGDQPLTPRDAPPYCGDGTPPGVGRCATSLPAIA